MKRIFTIISILCIFAGVYLAANFHTNPGIFFEVLAIAIMSVVRGRNEE
jgi:hypothetical protein